MKKYLADGLGIVVLLAFALGVLDALPMYDSQNLLMSVKGIGLVAWFFATGCLLVGFVLLVITFFIKKLRFAKEWLPVVVVTLYVFLIATNRLHAVQGNDFFAGGLKTKLLLLGLVLISLIIGSLANLGIKYLKPKIKNWQNISKKILIIWLVLGVTYLGLFVVGIYFPRQLVKDPGSNRSGKPNVILVTVDALRNDTVTKELMPHTEKFFEGGTRMDRAYSSSDWTAPAFASMMTGLSPTRLGDGAQMIESAEAKTEKQFIPTGAETLARVLQQNGYLTQAIVNNFLLTEHRGYAAGFDGYYAHEDVKWWSWEGADQLVTVVKLMNRIPIINTFCKDFYEVVTEKSDKPWQNKGAGELVNSSVKWLSSLKQKEGIFLWIHLTDTHSPYMTQKDFYPEIDVNPRAIQDLSFVDDVLKYSKRLRRVDKIGVKKLYEGEAQYADLQLSKLWRFLDDSGMSKETIVILSSDHGEEFWEHGDVGHTKTFYEESVRVPLLIRTPSPLRVSPPTLGGEKAVSTMDMKGSVMDLAGIKRRGEISWFDESYRKEIYLDANGSGPIQRAVVFGDWKLIEDVDGNRELYNLRFDPEEKNNVASVNKYLADKLSKDMHIYFDKEEKEGWGVKSVDRGVYTGY